MPNNLYDQPNEAYTRTRTDTPAREGRRAAARLTNRTAHVLASVGSRTGQAGKAMLQTAVLDLSSSGCDAADISHRLAIPEPQVRSLLAEGLDALSRRQTQTAEIVRAQADAKLSRIEARLNDLVESGEIDTTSLIRALEVQARITGQRVDLYAAKVRETDSDLSAAVQDVIREARQLDRDGIGMNQPASSVTLAITADPDDPK